VLLGILLFNLCGYQFLHAYLEEQASHQLQLRLDINNYDETTLITIKVPAEHLAYSHHSIQFERCNGQIEICGVPYCYVKRRLFNDSIEMLCILNQPAIELQRTKNDLFKLMNDLKPLSQDGKSGAHSYNGFSGDFFTIQESFQLKNPFCHFRKNIFCDTMIIPVHSIFSDEHPPEQTT